MITVTAMMIMMIMVRGYGHCSGYVEYGNHDTGRSRRDHDYSDDDVVGDHGGIFVRRCRSSY